MSFAITATPHISSGTCDYITIAWSGMSDSPSWLYILRNGSSVHSEFNPSATGSWADTTISLDVAYSYSSETTLPEYASATSYYTPKSCLAPTIGTSAISGSAITTSCTKNGSTPDYWNVYRDIDGGGYSLLTTRPAGSPALDDSSVSHGQTATYKWGSVISGYTEAISSASNSVMMVTTYTDTLNATVTADGVLTETFLPTDTLTAQILCLDEVLDQANYTSTVSATVTATSAVSSAQTLKTDFTYYIGTAVGAIYEQSLDYQYDDSATSGTSVPAAIVPTWWSKTIDFVDTDAENTGRWKCLYRVEYLYRDFGVIPVTVYVSTDGGATWTSKTKNIGTAGGTGKTEHAHFHFVITGQFFIFKIDWPSATYDFQFLGFDAVYQEMADQWEVSEL